MLRQPKNPKIAAILAFSSLLLPISGLHKFYLRQPLWGLFYLVLAWWTPIPGIASALEGVWYLLQQDGEFDKNFNNDIEASTERDRLSMGFLTKAIEPIQRWWTIADVKLAAVLVPKLDVNRATVEDWQRLPSVTLEQAQTFVNLCQAGVQFYCVEDLAAALSLPPHHFQLLQPALEFCYYDEAGTKVETNLTGKINPNRASLEMLLHVPGIDTDLAEAIVADRLAAGTYQNIADLQQRLSLPGELTSDLMHYLQF